MILQSQPRFVVIDPPIDRDLQRFEEPSAPSALGTGEAAEIVDLLPEGVVQTVVTSPPYWSLRDYGIHGQVGLESSVHEFAKKPDSFRMTELKVPSPAKQIALHQLLVAARKTVLREALSEVLGSLDPRVFGEEMAQFAPADTRRGLASAGIRNEWVFAVPSVLEANRR